MKLQEEILDVCKQGVLPLLEKVAQEVLNANQIPHYDGDSDKLLYEMGKYEGRKEAMDIYLDYFYSSTK